MKIERFEDIKSWQEARFLVKIIYDATKSNKNFTGDYKPQEFKKLNKLTIIFTGFKHYFVYNQRVPFIRGSIFN